VTERTYTTEEAARRLGVPAARIADWKHRGRVMPAGYVRGRGHDAPVYVLAELIPLAEEWQRRTATRRPKS
jgi:hypothetical protein